MNTAFLPVTPLHTPSSFTAASLATCSTPSRNLLSSRVRRTYITSVAVIHDDPLDTDSPISADSSPNGHSSVPLTKSFDPSIWDEIDVRALPSVAVVGRPNVGKSTLVNRFSSQFQGGAIVEDVEGITRDRTYRRTIWNGVNFAVVDTGGLVFDDDSVMLSEIRTQALLALQEASAAVLVVDSRAGVTPLDEQLASFLRRECKAPIFIAVNKCEGDDLGAADFWTLGLGEPMGVSAIHGIGTGDLLDNIVNVLPDDPPPTLSDVTSVAIVGRPNVGKSSLLNAMLGTDRSIVMDAPGTTRDAVDELIEVEGKTYRLIDTAGIRRRNSVENGTEYYMVNRAIRAIRRADIALLMLDVNEGAAEQDRKIADVIANEGRACVVLGNKWDLIEDKNNKSYQKAVDDVKMRVASIPWAAVELISVKEKQRIGKILEMVDTAKKQHARRISTSVLNEVLRDAVEWHRPPSSRGGRSGKIYYCTQVSSRPPTIAMFVNEPRLFSQNYRRYMEGRFRSQLGFAGTPIRVLWRGKARAPDGF